MRRYRIAVFAAMLCGCTTIREMREHPPSAVYTSPKSEPALETCLAGALSWISQPAVIRGETATELSFGEGDAAVLLVSLLPLPNGSTRVEAREQLAYGARVRHNIEACAEGRR